MKKVIFILVLSLGIPLLLQSQPLSIGFPDTTVAPGIIQIPVSLSGSTLVSSFDLEFKYYNVIGSFLQISSYNPLLNGLFEVEHMIGGATDWVRLHWESPEVIALTGNTLFTVEIDYWGGSTTLEWLDWTDSTCAFYGPAGVVPLTTFIPGSINQASGLTENPDAAGDYSVFPNPYSGGELVLHRKIDDFPENVCIIDPVGRIVYEVVWPVNTRELSISHDLLRLAAGYYSVKFQRDQTEYSCKLVVQ